MQYSRTSGRHRVSIPNSVLGLVVRFAKLQWVTGVVVKGYDAGNPDSLLFEFATREQSLEPYGGRFK